MDYKLIAKDIKEKRLAPIYLFHGDEPYYIDFLTHLAEQEILLDSEKAFNQSVLYGKDVNVQRITDEAMQFPMMSSRRLIVIKEAQDIKSIGELGKYCESPNNQSVLVLAYKKKFDKRQKLYKIIDSKGVVFESKKVYDNQVPGWIQNYCAENGYKIDMDASNLIAEFLGNRLDKISNELRKLFVNQDSEKTITINEVEENIGISKEYNVFELQKAIGQANFLKCVQIIKYMGENPKTNPIPMVVSSLYNYFSKVFITSVNSKQNDKDLMRSIGLSSPYFLREYKAAARNFPYNKMSLVMNALKDMDLQSKGVGHRNLKESDILTEFLTKIFLESQYN